MLPEDNILFKGIDQNDCHRMITCFNPDIRRYKAGSTIAGFEDYTDKIGIVLSGRAVMVRYDINGVRTIIETLEEQSVFGAFFTFTVSKRSSMEIISGRAIVTSSRFSGITPILFSALGAFCSCMAFTSFTNYFCTFRNYTTVFLFRQQKTAYFS